MKASLIGLLLLSVSSQVIAGPGGGGGGVGVTPTLRVKSNETKDFFDNRNIVELRSQLIYIQKDDIEALVSKDGSYARFHDLRDGFVKFEGAEATNEYIILDPEKPYNEVKSIVLRNGRMVFISNAFTAVAGDGKKLLKKRF